MTRPTFHAAYTVAKNTFKESIRDKVLYVVAAFAFLFITFTLFLGSISLGEDVHVVRSLGLAGMYLFGLFITIFLGTALVYKELERKTLYFILSKPITRGELLVGKFAGLWASVSLSIVGMLLVYLGVVYAGGKVFDTLAVVAVLLQLFEMALVIALSLFFSTYARPLAGAVYALLVVYIGHSLGLLVAVAAKSGGFSWYIAQALYYVLPNMEKFNIRDLVLYGAAPSLMNMFFVFLYASVYVAVLLYVATALLKRREL